MRRRLGAALAIAAAIAVVAPWEAQPTADGRGEPREALSGAPAAREAAPEALSADREARRAPERPRAMPPPPRPRVPDIACSYPARLRLDARGCAPRRDEPLTPGAAPGRPWLIRG